MDQHYQFFVIEGSIVRGLALSNHFTTVKEAIIVTWVHIVQLLTTARPVIYAQKAHIAHEECPTDHSFVL